jgi:hypothetical protein
MKEIKDISEIKEGDVIISYYVHLNGNQPSITLFEVLTILNYTSYNAKIKYMYCSFGMDRPIRETTKYLKSWLEYNGIKWFKVNNIQ